MKYLIYILPRIDLEILKNYFSLVVKNTKKLIILEYDYFKFLL